MIELYLGIDPGQTGAVACISKCRSHVGVFDWPGDERAAADLILDFRTEILDSVFRLAVIEHQQAFKGQGIASTGKLMMNYGCWLGILAAYNIPTRVVRPNIWKRGVVPPRADKKESLAVARRLFPGLADELKRVKDHGRAEALLIALYGMEG